MGLTIIVPTVQGEWPLLIEHAIREAFGPGTYWVHVRTDCEPWLVAVGYPGQSQAITSTITPQRARSPRDRQILAQALCRKSATLGWLEWR
jgi:hypothetical protein